MPAPRNADKGLEDSPPGVRTRSQTRLRDTSRPVSRTPQRSNRVASFPRQSTSTITQQRSRSADIKPQGQNSHGTSTEKENTDKSQSCTPTNTWRTFSRLGEQLRSTQIETRSLKDTIDRLQGLVPETKSTDNKTCTPTNIDENQRPYYHSTPLPDKKWLESNQEDLAEIDHQSLSQESLYKLVSDTVSDDYDAIERTIINNPSPTSDDNRRHTSVNTQNFRPIWSHTEPTVRKGLLTSPDDKWSDKFYTPLREPHQFTHSHSLGLPSQQTTLRHQTDEWWVGSQPLYLSNRSYKQEPQTSPPPESHRETEQKQVHFDIPIGQTSKMSKERDNYSSEEEEAEFLEECNVTPLQKVSLPNSVGPEYFRGTEKEDAKIWWTNFRKYATLKGWDDKTALATCSLFFRDAAAIWFDSLDKNKKKTLKALHDAFAKRYYLDDALKWVCLDKFNSREQKTSESAADFAQEMMKLGRDLKKSDKETMEGVVRGLKTPIRTYVMEHDPKNLEEALHYAKIAEAFRKDSTSSTTEGLAELTKQVADLKAQLTTGLGAIKVAAIAPKYENSYKGMDRFPNGQRSYSENRNYNHNQSQPPPQNNYQGQRQTTPQHRFRGQSDPWQNRQSTNNTTAATPYYQRYRPCRSCGETSHDRAKCRFRNYQCLRCHQVGHLQRVCGAPINDMNK